MDVLVTLREKSWFGSGSNIYKAYINWGGGAAEINCADINSEEPIFKCLGEPLAIDYNRDMIIDLYGLDEEEKRVFWIFGNHREKPRKIHQAAPDALMINNTEHKFSMKIPNANAYLDLNEDFTADLFVQTDKHYEIWYGRNDKMENYDFIFNHTIDLAWIGVESLTVGQAVFADFELKGTENIILPICIRKDCANSTILVHDGKDFRDIHVNFKDPQAVQWKFVPPQPDDPYLKTITARSGDFNMDGYPDLIMTLQTVSGNRMQTFLMENVPCKMCNKPLKRSFEVKWNALYPMGNDTVAGAFYDFYQDGKFWEIVCLYLI